MCSKLVMLAGLPQPLPRQRAHDESNTAELPIEEAWELATTRCICPQLTISKVVLKDINNSEAR
jgi:hypothetical protein